MDQGVYRAIVAALYPLIFDYFIGTASALIVNWWQERKRTKQLKVAAEHLAKE